MPSTSDPFYNRKPVPDAFIEHVGDTGLSRQDEYLGRERKLSSQVGDLRKFSNPKGVDGKLDPHYARKPVPDSMLYGVGDTGLSTEEEYLVREKKMHQNGVDIRKFSISANGGLEPTNDPYYGRKPVAAAQIHGVGESGMSRAEEFETRENKASLFDLSRDPFEQLAGSGHRGSVAAVASAGAADARRRSSAIGPDATRAASNVQDGPARHSGYTGDNGLSTITSGRDNFPKTAVNRSAAENMFNYGENMGSNAGTTTTTSTTTTSTTHATASGLNQHGLYHDVATTGPGSTALNERL